MNKHGLLSYFYYHGSQVRTYFATLIEEKIVATEKPKTNVYIEVITSFFFSVYFLPEASVVVDSLEEPGLHGPLHWVSLVDGQQ